MLIEGWTLRRNRGNRNQTPERHRRCCQLACQLRKSKGKIGTRRRFFYFSQSKLTYNRLTMATATPASSQTTDKEAGTTQTGFDRVINLTTRLATSWVGLLTVYAGALLGAVVAFQKFKEPLAGVPLWGRVAIVAAPLVLALFHTIPAFIEQRRTKQLTQITGSLQPGYFQLAPREEETSFTRADGKHHEVLRWLQQSSSPVLYLTGLSGSGKSSLLAASVLPNLERENAVVVRLRGYQDPLSTLERELRLPGVVWQRVASDTADLPSLLERASRRLQSRRLLVVFDQFEEFVILQDLDKHVRFNELIAAVRQRPIAGVTFLFVFRSDYIGVIEKLALPGLNQDTNWKEVPPFSEGAARDFMRGSGLRVSDDLLRDVLREAAEIEQTKGLIRPITINLCGLVLGRFATGLPRGFRPGQLIRGFLRESVLLPRVRDIAPKILTQLISSYVTKRPRTVAELAEDTSINPAEVRGCLRVLGHSDRAIVRPLDAGQETWEISHDFLVPLLDSIVTRWSVSLWRRTRPWLPWVAATCIVVMVIIASQIRRDPIVELESLGWHIHEGNGGLSLQFDGLPPKQSLSALLRIHEPINMNLDTLGTVSEWGDLNNLSKLVLICRKDCDLSPLTNLKNLQDLFLTGPGIRDLSPVGDLLALTKLQISSENVDDLLPLQALTKLSELNLATDPKIRDLSPLTNLNLLELDLSDTNVTDLSPLKKLMRLSTLRLYNTNQDALSQLSDLGLSDLLVGGPNVTDLSPLKNLKRLSTLTLYMTEANLSPLKDFSHLSSLTIIVGNIPDTPSLGNSKEPLSRSQYTTSLDRLSVLKDLESLSSLQVTGKKVRDISALRGFTYLRQLGLESTRVSDLSPLRDLVGLSVLGLSDSEVSDLFPLKKLKNLAYLNLSDTDVSDVSPLKSLQSLSYLNLSNTRVSDVSPLKDLTKLTKLDLRGTEVRDISPLKDLTNLTTLR